MAIAPRSPEELLRDVPVLTDLAAEELGVLAAATEVRKVARAEALFQEGQPAEGLFVVRTGEVKLGIANQNAAHLQVWALGMDGSRQEPLPVTAQNGVLSVTINTRTLANGPTPFFEVAPN